MMRVTIVLVVVVAICVAAEPPRYRRTQQPQQRRFLARQEAAQPAPSPTGYPAAGVTPEVPFDLPTSTVKPDVSYLPPDNTYGPPEQQPEAVYGPPEAEVHQPENTYGPPEEVPAIEDEVEEPVEPSEEQPQPDVKTEVEPEEEILVAVAEDGTVIAVSTSYDQNDSDKSGEKPARLVYQRFPQSRRHQPAPVPARLIKLKAASRPAKLQLLQPQSFAYTAPLQAW